MAVGGEELIDETKKALLQQVLFVGRVRCLDYSVNLSKDLSIKVLIECQ
jgi:hypothetical protein